MHSFREIYLMVVLSISTLLLHLPMQSVSITTKAESSITAHGKVYSILFYVVKFVGDSAAGQFLAYSYRSLHSHIFLSKSQLLLDSCKIKTKFIQTNYTIK